MFMSPNLYRKVNFCGTVEEWALTRDHIPIRTQINNAGCPPVERRRLALGKLDSQSLIQSIQKLNWATSKDLLEAFQEGIKQAFKKHCLQVQLSQQAH